MNDLHLDAKLVAAANRSDNASAFAKQTMERIRLLHVSKQAKHGLVYWLRHLHKPALIALAIATTLLLSGIVYAVVQFAPALLKITSKTTTDGGATEYNVAGFEECKDQNGVPPTNKYELNSELPAQDDAEIAKILQAKCELTWLDGFVKTTWPTYGANPVWKEGDQIYYARTNILGIVLSASETGAEVDFGSDVSHDKPVGGEKIKAYTEGKEIPVSDIHVGDAVFTIQKVTETYHEPPLWNKINHIEYHGDPNTNPHPLGTLALFKLSLPRDYYGKKQAYLIEIPACINNPGEYCPSTPSSDIYPLGGGESGTNKYFKPDLENSISRNITGTVTELTDSSATIKSRSGNTFVVTLEDGAFAQYNKMYAKNFSDFDAHLKVGSNISILYTQPKQADPHTITKEQVQMVSLMLKSLSPKKYVKPY